ncbi:5-formyltetrahydrofolate cyclo-ligase [Kineosporia succinea]|uniref:5-formyltetrahydrofolate cyclo-ligase n=1 Tax=Kineosporia succinea TaxID=84632 RepID=A0ABT9NZ87_9ACTN|nr:5-formyltetrahydrofolate cyclo-ligase [Kineosporia succinea]MDP9825754.1 5-formyltetrahydrofolate cyclo-ligase [Kineosporia succinea]
METDGTEVVQAQPGKPVNPGEPPRPTQQPVEQPVEQVPGVERAREAKQALRRRVRRSRAARTGEQKRADEVSLTRRVLTHEAVRRASTIAVYASLPDEPGTGELRAALHREGVRVLLPVVVEGEGPPTLDWALDTGPLATTGVLELPEPTGERLGPDAVTQADVLLIPALAVDTSGVRMGRGRGYYDVALARFRDLRPNATVIALVHDDELLDASTTPVPAEPHDRRVDAVITPRRSLSSRA